MLHFDHPDTTFQAIKAGEWYPRNSFELKQNLDEYLTLPKEYVIPSPLKPRIIIVPHPGLAFGGPTAGYAYSVASKFQYRNIFIVATSHYSYFDSIVVGDFKAYETPFGPISGNREISSYLKYRFSQCQFEPEIVQQEHAVEMQFPFIKKCFPNAQIIPIILSADNMQNAELAAKGLYSALTPEDLVIISTDLSHYPSYQDAQILDKKTLAVIQTGDPAVFLRAVHEEKLPGNTSTAVCGAVGVLAGLYLAQYLGISDIQLLHYENSGDRPFGDKKGVVGYGAVAFFAPEEEKFSETLVLSESEKKLLRTIVMETLEAALRQKSLPTYEDKIDANSPLRQLYGAFVTLKIFGNLRGCMGNFEPDVPLYQVIQDTALSSAFRDPRFPPLALSELESITMDISILSPRKKISSYLEIIPGKHGVYVQKGYAGGTYLPQVAPEQGWDRETMLTHLCGEKAGLSSDAWRDGSAQLFTYTALVFE